MKRFILLTCIGILASICGCSRRALIPGEPSYTPARWWNWGGDAGRCGFADSELRPPMDLAWIRRAQAGVERALGAFDSYLVFGTKDGAIVILEAERGKPVKRIKEGKKAGVTCVVDGARLITARRWGDGVLSAMDLNTRRLMWRVPSGFVEGEPLIADGRIYIANVKGTLLCFDADSGARIWEKRLGSPVSGSPASAGDAVVVTAEDGWVWCVDAGSGGTRWRRRFPSVFIAGPVVVGGRVFAGTKDGLFFALDHETGETVWDETSRGGVFETAACGGNSVFYGTSLGDLICRDAMTGDELWRFETQAVIGASPLVTRDAVVVGNLDGWLYVLDRMTGKELWKFKAKGRIRTTPLLWDGMLFAASENEFVYGFGHAR